MSRYPTRYQNRLLQQLLGVNIADQYDQVGLANDPNTPFGSSNIRLDSENPPGFNDVPIYIVALDIDQDENNASDFQDDIIPWAFNYAYDWLLNRLNRSRDAMDYAQIRLLRPDTGGEVFTWDITSEFYPTTDVVDNFLIAYGTALQSNDRQERNLLAAYGNHFEFRITFVLTNYVTINTRNRTAVNSVPSITRDNLSDIVNFSRSAASTNRQQAPMTDLNRRKRANRWLLQNRAISGRKRPFVIKKRKTNEEAREAREVRQKATEERRNRPAAEPKRAYKKRRTAQEMAQLRAAIQAAGDGEDITASSLTSNVSKFQMLGGEIVPMGNQWSAEQKQRYNEAKRAKRQINGIYDDCKKKIFHHSSLDKFYKHSKAVLHVPNTWDEGYCIAMAFMKSECRFYKKDGTVSESEPHEFQPEEGRYACCPILEPFSHLIDQDCDFITGDCILLFNPYKYPSDEPIEFLKYAYQPPPDVVQKWYQAAQNMHLYVCQEIGMDLDPNSEATMQAYCEVFDVFLSVYNIETKVKRSIVISPTCAEVDLRKEEEFKVVSVLVSKQHCSAITNLRAFLKTTMSANRTSIHNYCVFCQKMWTSNNQTREEAQAHFHECIEEKRGILSCDNFSKDRNKLMKDIHPEQFTFDRKRGVHICNLCKVVMDQGLTLGQIHHVCYMKKDGKLKMGDEKEVYVFDFECEQKRQGTSSTFIHSVNLVCVRSVYPNAEGIIERFLFHTLDEFVAYVMSHNTKQRVYLAHNGSKYDVQFVVRYLETNMIPFDFIPAPSSMHAYLRVCIRFGASASASFLDFRHFMPGSLKGIAQSLNLASQKGDFPHHFNNGFHEYYEGRLPILNHQDDYWCLRSKRTEEEVIEFGEWFHEQESIYCTCDDQCTCAKKKWSFQEEIIKYCWLDVDVLAEAARNYRDWLVTLGEGEDAVEGWKANALDPFQYLTIPQLAMTVLMSGLPEEENVTITPYKKRRERVPLAIAWMERMQQQMEHKIRHVGNWRQEFFEPNTRRFIDGVTDDMHIFVCLNCEFHGCNICHHEEFHTGKDHPTRPGTYGRVAYDTERFLRTLFKTYSIDKTHVIWQHELVGYSPYEEELGKVIIDREMFCGGRTEVFSPFCNADLYPDDEIQYHDVCSLYPYVCAFSELPIGNPEHYCGSDIVRERLLDTTTLDRYHGYVRCHVVPNQRDVLGLLPFHEPKTGRLEFPLFPMTGTWGTEELRLAIEQGYVVEEIYEVYHWPPAERSSTFMRGFVSYFLRLKQEAEGWKKQGATSEDPSEEEKELLIEKVYEENGFISKMRPEKVKKNAVNRQFAKIYLNSLWGKFCQKAHTDNYTTIHGYQEFASLWNDPHVNRHKMHFRHLSAGTWKVRYEAHQEFAQANAKYNIFLAAWVTQTARCVLHRRMIRIGPERILYCDTDSIMALLPKEAPDMTGHGLGNWVNEYPDARIKRLTALAPKFYFLQFDGDDELLKSKGIMMSHENRRLLTGFSLGKQILELFYPKTNELQQKIPFQGFIGMKNMLIGINSTSPHFAYGTMLTKETEDKKLQPVISKRHLVPYVRYKNVVYEEEKALDKIPRIYTLPKGYYRSVEEMSFDFY